MQDECITIRLGLSGLQVLGHKETQRQIIVEVEYRAASANCPRCGEGSAKVHDRRQQTKQDRRLWDKVVFLILHKRRFRCPRCRKVFTEADPVCGVRRRSSLRFREYLAQEAMHQTIRHVASKEGVGEALVRRCLTVEARRLLDAPEQLYSARILGLDEFSIRKGQVYDTGIMDIEHKRVLGVVSGRGQKEVAGFLDRLPDGEAVEVAVMDMHEPFRQAVEMSLPGARIVVDKFHVLRHVHHALDQVRLSLQSEVRKGRLYRSRYLLLRGFERLTCEDREGLEALLESYPKLRRAWALKESFRLWYRSGGRAEAEQRLAIWERSVKEEGPAPFRKLFPMLRDWRQEILNYFDHPYTNGFVEGKNNRIKVIKRLAYGYRNRESFRQRILLSNVDGTDPKVA